MIYISGLSGNRPGGSEGTEESDGGAACASLCAKELMEGVDIGDSSFIVNQGENVTSREANDNVFIFTDETWGPEIDTETGLEVT